MIRSLELINWKTHKHSTLNFSKGINLITGIMGSGKSSIVDAISFAFFGTMPSLSQRRITLDNLINGLDKEQQQAEVKLTFDVGNDMYVISRKISRSSGSSATLYKNGTYIQAQATKVNEEIESLLKIDYDMFSRAIYAEQNKINYFLEIPKGERKKQMDRMLGLDHFTTAEENVTTFINQVKNSVNETEQTLAKIDVESFRTQLEKLNEEKKSLQVQQTSLSEQSATIEVDLSKSKKDLEVLKESYESKKKIDKQIAELKSKIDTLSTEIEKIKALGVDELAANKELKIDTDKKIDTEDQLKKIKEDERSSNKKLAEASANLKNTLEKIKERDKILSSIKGKEIRLTENKLSVAETSAKQSSDIIAAGKARTKDLTLWIEELDKHISKCPVCERTLDDELREKLLTEKKEIIKSTQEQINQHQKMLITQNKEVDSIRLELNALKVASERLKEYLQIEKYQLSYKAEVESHSKELEKTRAAAEQNQNQLDKINANINKINSTVEAANRMKRHIQEIEDSKSELLKKTQQISTIAADEKTIYALQENITKQSSQLADIKSKLQSNIKYMKNIAEQAQEKSIQLAKFESMSKEIAHKTQTANNLGKFKHALVDTESTLRSRLISSINMLMLELWPRLYPYEDYSAIRISAKNDDYLLELKTTLDQENGGWLGVDRIASGGEKSISSLTMRIAMSMVIVPNLRWIILDEPTHNIDSQGIEKIIYMLGDSLPNIVEQLFIITHDESLKSINEAKIFQLDRDKASNGHTSIAEA